MKTITCLSLSAMFCAAGPLAAAPQNAPATPPPARPFDAQRQAAATDAQAAQNAITEYQRAMSLVADQGTAGRSDHPLIIRYSETDAKSLASMNEDMNIMGHILEKAVRQNFEDKQREAMGIRLMTVSVPDGARNVQIEGYGAVFQLGVNFPLVGPPAEKTDDAVDKEPTNSTWDETRRELYGPRGRGGRRGGLGGPAMPLFDARRVESLKNSILDALKNASHMQNLKTDESVTVVVTSTGGPLIRVANPAFGGDGATAWTATGNRIQIGDKIITSDGSNVTMETLAPSGAPGATGRAVFGGGSRDGGNRGGGFGGTAGTTAPGTTTVTANQFVFDPRTGSTIATAGAGSNAAVRFFSPAPGQRGGMGAGTESVLTIRAKKSDIDAFAKGKLNLDEFRTRALVQIY